MNNQAGLGCRIVGVAIGLVGATALTRVVSGLLYEVQPHDAIAFVGASVGLAPLVLSARLVPAWRATQVDPIVAAQSGVTAALAEATSRSG